MSRAVIGGVVALVVSALTATAYFVTTSRLEGRIRKDVEQRVAKAQELLTQNASLEGLGLLKRVLEVTRDEQFVTALKSEGETARSEQANVAFRRYLASLDEGEPRPEFMALADAKGDVVAVLDVSKPTPDAWKNDKGELVYPAVKLALEKRQATSDVWSYEGKFLMRVGVAPVIDLDVDDVIGALVVGHELTAKEAKRQQGLLGMDVAFFYADRVHATSFVRGKDEDVEKQGQLKGPLFDGGLAKAALEKGLAERMVTVELGGEEYMATAGRLPRFSSAPLPADYPAPAAGAVVLMSLTDALAPLGTVKLTILLLGAGALVISLLAMLITAKRILAPLDEIEVGINDIINGNLDRTFRPVGSDLDGLANALNVMLARMLGRPEPGEEEYDDDGNVVQSSPMAFDSEQMSPADAEAVALAQEAEPDYYKRIHAEYVEARRRVGEKVEGITFEGFVTKLRLNEANLKSKHSCRAVRFKVVVKDNKVSLKPVPIF